MNQNKLSSRVYTLMKAALAAAALPVIFIYVMIAKPDYRIMNTLSHIVVPVAQWTGDVITAPVRFVGNIVVNIRNLSELRTENEELRAQLDIALQHKDMYEIAIAENKKMLNEIAIANARPQSTIMADVTDDYRAFNHSTFLINKGASDGIEPGQIVISTDGMLIGTIIDSGVRFARVRSLIDSDANIPVRIAGSDVRGFLQGNGTSSPELAFFSDKTIKPNKGTKLITNNIGGTIPNGIFVGTMIDDKRIKIKSPCDVSRVIVLKFDIVNEYK